MIYPSEAVTAEGVRRWLLDRLGDAGQCIVKGPVYQRQNSHIFYAECDALPSAAAIKWCLQTYTLRPDSDSAVRQFEALRRVADAMQADPRYTVPRPYLLDRERALLAIEWIGGAPMTASIASWRCGTDNAHDLMVQAGNWLRHFHQAHRLPDGPLDVEAKLRSASEYDDCALARDQVFAQGLAELRRSAAAAASVNLERSWIHGDFKTDNLIISGQRIVGIDVQIRHENTVVYDVAPFLNDLELSFCHPMAWRPASVRARLIAAFVDAYSEAKSDRLLLALTWVRLHFMFAAWDHMQARGLSRLRTAILGHCFRSATARLSAQLRRLC